MKKSYLFLAATAILAFASCSDNNYVGDQEENTGGGGPISFGFDVPSATRGTDTDAGKLGNQFIVWGEKNETENSGAAAASGNLVFKNYIVNYVNSSAYTTTSNTKNWEYVGFKFNDATATIPTTAYTTNVTPNSGTGAQTIKYWDYAASYTFTAVSALNADLTSGYVTITKTESKTGDGATAYDKGYTVVLTANAHPENLYFSDRVPISTGASSTDAANVRGGYVNFTFRNALSQVRVGMYETVPGYKVRLVKFYYVDNANPSFATMETGATDRFHANVPNISTSSGATLTVTYQKSGAAKNYPTISVGGAGTTANYIALGDASGTKTGLKGETTENAHNGTTLAESASSPTYDTTDGGYAYAFSQETNNKPLMLKLDYELYNEITGEIIKISGKTAEVPAQYLQWKPNFKYTYLFKITDDNLNPITFDAVVVEDASTGSAEYITTVSEPSITTFGVKNDKYTTGKNEYETGTDIYITIVKDNAVVNPAFMSDTHLYKVTTADETNFPITEASVAEAYDHPTGNKITIGGCICTPWSSDGKAKKVTSVPAEDGTTITVAGAIKFSPAAGDDGTYAVQYSYGSTEYTYTAVTGLSDGNSVEGLYESDGASTPTYTLTTDVTYNSSKTYYDRIPTGTSTKRVYKVIKVVAP